MKDQRIRDPIYNLIKFSAGEPDDVVLWNLIQTRPMQRLRRIRQLGFSEFVFPGAVHTRFSHSIGTMEMARKLMAIIDQSDYSTTGGSSHQIHRTATLCAALLHDVGHGPFSHVFEEACSRCGIKRDHEEWTADIIGDPEISEVLRAHSEELPALVSSFFTTQPGSNPYTVLISSNLDADRLDFLQRDRYFSGSVMGSIDIEWLVDCLKIKEIEQNESYPFQFVVSRKGIRVIEEYLTSYAAMYEGLYFHKTTRAAQMMLLMFLEEIFAGGNVDEVLESDEPIRIHFENSENATVDNYLRLDDFSIWRMLDLCSSRDIGRSTELANRILKRDFFKCVEIPQDHSHPPPLLKVEELKRLMKDEGLEYMEDKIKSKGFKQYDAEEIDSLKDIFVEPIDGSFPVQFHTCSETAKLLKTSNRDRFYFETPEQRDRARELWKNL